MEVHSQSFDNLIEIARAGRDRSVWTDVVKKAIVQGDHAKQAVAERQLDGLPDVLDVLRANKSLRTGSSARAGSTCASAEVRPFLGSHRRSARHGGQDLIADRGC